MGNIPLNIDFQQVLLHLLNFAILFAVLYFLLYKPVKNFMDKRKSEYEAENKQAEEKLSEAQQLKESYEEKMKAADEEISARMARAQSESQKNCDEMEAKARAQADEIIEKARKQAESEKEKILGEARTSVVQLAEETAHKTVFGNFSDFFDEFLKKAGQGKKDNG